MKKRKGFSLVELSIWALAVGVLLAIAMPRNDENVIQAKTKADKMQINAIASAVSNYHYEVKKYPPNLEALTVKYGDLGPWLPPTIPASEWGTPYNYVYDDDNNVFAVWSNGFNKVDETGGGAALANDYHGDDYGKTSQ